MKKLSLFILFLGLFMASQAQPVLIEKVEKTSGKFVIPYEKYRLPNGLTIIISEDHSDPLVHVQVTYHVGSARETAGKSGFAHFFEHMMFQGSKHIGDEQHFKILSEIGASNINGNTERDITNYYETIPSNQLETALWLESDRMGFLLDSVTQKKFENQRDAVKNEKGQNVDNRPYGKIEETVGANLYPMGHPYSWPVIGYVNDLNRVQLQDLKNFFLRWYGPNNAVLVLVGDVNTAEALKLAEKYFGTINKCPDVKKQRVDAAVLPDDRYAHFSDNVYLPLVMMVYPTVPQYHADEPALDLLGALLGQGKGTVLYKNFEKAEKAAQSFASNSGSELAGEFQIGVAAFPDFSADQNKLFDDVEKLLRASLDEFEKTPITDEDLARVKGGIEASLISGAQSAIGKASFLARWYTITGKQMNIQDEVERYNKVTKEDILRVYNRYIKNRKALIVNVHPKFMTGEGDSKNATAENPISATSEDEFKGLTYIKPVDNFDRSKRPNVGASKAAIIPQYKKSELDNGLKIIGTRSDETPEVEFNIFIRGGHLLDDPTKAGLAAVTADMMNEGTEKYSAEKFETELSKIGSNISFSSSDEMTVISVSCLTKNLDLTLKLLEDKLFHPKFENADLKRIKRQIIQNFKTEYSNAGLIASKNFRKFVYGNSPLASYYLGNAKTIGNINLDDVKNYYNQYYSPSVATLVYVGDLSPEEFANKISFLNTWKKVPVQLPNFNGMTNPVKPQVFLINKIDAPQSNFVMGCLALPYDYNGEYFKAGIMNFAFGGTFNSRLNLNLREDKGYTYGIRSGFSGSKNQGTFSISASVRSTATDSAIKEIMAEMTKYKADGITSEELDFTRKTLNASDALRFETPGQKAGYLYRLSEYSLPDNYLSEQNNIVDNISKDEIKTLANKYLNIDNYTIIIVGDKKVIKKNIEKLGFKIKEVDPDGL